VFEKFTERAIKAVMLAQQEAKALRRPEVGAEHIVMGLIAEEVCSMATNIFHPPLGFII
jgi:ATP-dependent Clp protease ATP-binding subunit ClpC